MEMSLFDAYHQGIALSESGRAEEALRAFDAVIRNMAYYKDVTQFADIFQYFTKAAKDSGQFKNTFMLFQEYLTIFTTGHALYPQLLAQFCNFVLYSFETITEDTQAQVTQLQKEIAALQSVVARLQYAATPETMSSNRTFARESKYKAILEEAAGTIPVTRQGTQAHPITAGEIPSSHYNAAVLSREVRTQFMQGVKVCSMSNSSEVLINKINVKPAFSPENGGYFLIESPTGNNQFQLFPNFSIDLNNSNVHELITTCFELYGDVHSERKVYVLVPATVIVTYKNVLELENKGKLFFQ